MRINILHVQAILATIQEEDTVLGFGSDDAVADAVATLDNKIQELLDQGELSPFDVLLSFE